MGKLANRFASPNPAAMTSEIKPAETPRICGRLARNPKFAPDAASIMLFGPGVKADTNAKSVNDRMVGKSIKYFCLIGETNKAPIFN